MSTEETPEERKRRRARERSAKWRAANPDKAKAAYTGWRERNREEHLAAHRERMAADRAANPQKRRDVDRRFYEKNAERIRPINNARAREKYAADPLARRAEIAASRARNPGKAQAAIARWARANPERRREIAAKSRQRPEAKARHTAAVSRRKATQLQATPRWANGSIIREIYEFAAFMTIESGEPWEVDHEVPLISKIVCGLHWEGNLRAIPASQNRSKGNRHWQNMP